MHPEEGAPPDVGARPELYSDEEIDFAARIAGALQRGNKGLKDLLREVVRVGRMEHMPMERILSIFRIVRAQIEKATARSNEKITRKITNGNPPAH